MATLNSKATYIYARPSNSKERRLMSPGFGGVSACFPMSDGDLLSYDLSFDFQSDGTVLLTLHGGRSSTGREELYRESIKTTIR